MGRDRFEINFVINPDINNPYELTAIDLADRLCAEADANDEKGAILCQLHFRGAKRASIIGRFIKKECSIEIEAVLEKYGYGKAAGK
jgi:hypothetical protein